MWALDLDDFKGEFCGQGSHPLLGHLRTLLKIGTIHVFILKSLSISQFYINMSQTNVPLFINSYLLFANRMYSLHCHSELPPLPPTTTPDPSKTTTPATTTTTTHAPGTGFCNGKPDGMYPHQEDKNSFYVCAGGVTYVRQCGAGTVFDDKCKCCVWP